MSVVPAGAYATTSAGEAREVAATPDRLASQQARAQHYRRVRGIRAARDRRDHHRAVPDLVLAAELDRRGLLQLLGRQAEAALLHGRAERGAEGLLHLRERHAVLRTLRSRQARLDRGEIELERVAELRIRGLGAAEQPLLLAVALDQ